VKCLRQVADVDEHVGGDHNIENLGSRLQELDQIAADQIVVDVTLLGDLEHVRGNIDPGQRSSKIAGDGAGNRTGT